MAKRYIRRRGWKALKGGGAMWTGNPDDEILVETDPWAVTNGRIEVIELRKGMNAMRPDRDELYELMLKRQARLGNDWPADDPEWCTLYDLYKRALPAQPAPVEKSDVPGDRVWATITRLAKQLQDAEPGTLTSAEAIERVCYERPDLYAMYRREQAGTG